jgi:hypothetical protein
LPEVISGKIELDFEDLRLEDKHGFVQLFNGILLQGNLVCSFSFQRMTAENTVLELLEY